MKRLFAFLLCFAIAVLCACASQASAVRETAAPTLAEGSHGANETPIVRTQDTVNAQRVERMKEETIEKSVSEKEFMDSVFAPVGKLYFRENELEVFRAFDQTAEHTFLIQDYFGAVSDERTEHAGNDMAAKLSVYNEYAQKTAKTFADLGCKTEVRRYSADVDGGVGNSDICFVTTTPEHLWEISDKVEPLCLVEGVSDALRQRFDSMVWSSEG